MSFYDFRQLNLGTFFTSTFSRDFLRFIGTFGLVSGGGVECIGGTDVGCDVVIEGISGTGGVDHVVEWVSGRPKTASCSVS